MTTKVVVLGAGYAGAGTVKSLQREAGDDLEITWISKEDYHLVLHESHRVIRDTDVGNDVTVPVEEIKSDDTEFVEAHVEGVDVDEREVELDDGTVEYDYLLIALGSKTAFYGIPGLEEHSLTLKSLDDAVEIHENVRQATENATRDDPAKVVIGGAGLSGIQSAGEVAEYRDEHDVPIEIYLVEGLENVYPPGTPELQERLRNMLEERDINILTGEFIGEVDETTAYIGEKEDPDDGESEYKTELDYDVLVWAGGITGREVCEDADLEKDERSNRVNVSSDFTTDDERVFAIGDAAIIDQGDEPAPPTAQAAWQAAEVAGENIVRKIEGKELKTWEYDDKGTLISVGEKAVAHDIKVPPGVKFPVETFGGFPGKFLKKFVAARWIADMSSWGRALGSWDSL